MIVKKNVDFKKISSHNVPEGSPGFLLWHVSTAWRGSIERILKSIGLTHPQFVILAALGWLTRDGERVTQAAVGKMAGLDPNTVSQIVRGLEHKGYISREKSTDGRAKNPLLTISGSDILKKALPAVEAVDAAFFQHLSLAERESMLSIFKKLTVF